MQVSDLLRAGMAELSAAGIEQSRVDVELLLCHCLGKTSRSALFLAASETVSHEALVLFQALLARRKNREPLAYILGEQEFWSLTFKVTPDVLIPRPETEFLLEQVLRAMAQEDVPDGRVMDLCCGSGVIAIILARELGRTVTAIDLSPGALQVAQENCRHHGVANRVQLVRSDLLAGISSFRRYSLVVSNPPYVSTEDVLYHVEPEVGRHEPRMALDGGARGLEIIERICGQIADILLPGGLFFMEIGYDQGEAVQDMFSQPLAAQGKFVDVTVLQDYAGRDRVLRARMTKEE